MSFQLISSANPSTVSTVTISSIPQTYKTLQILYQLRFDGRATANDLRLTFNGSSTSDYSWRLLRGDGSGVSSTNNTNGLEIQPGFIEGTNAQTAVFSNGSIYIGNYASSSYSKPVIADNVSETSATFTQYDSIGAGIRNNTDAITSITFAASDTFVGTIWLYGIS
jgi:hypothetical protein